VSVSNGNGQLSEQTRAAERFYGKYPGTVLSNEAQDGAAHRGELRVQVSGILEENPDGSGQRPIEVVAKPSFLPGYFFIPEANAKVWVEFIAGEINCPIWTGVWYPQDATPQTVDDAAPTEFQKIIRTASGHVVQLDDTDREWKIVVRHKSGSAIEIDKDGKITITDTGDDTAIVSNKISLGTQGGAAEPLVLGDTLKTKLEDLIGTLSTHVKSHVHPTGVGPSGPAATGVADSVALDLVKSQLSQILSQQNTTD
jgi:hypothetical protein